MPGGPDAGPALQLLRTSRGRDRLTRASALPVVPDARQVKWQQTLPGSLSTKSGANSGFQLEILRGSLSPMNGVQGHLWLWGTRTPSTHQVLKTMTMYSTACKSYLNKEIFFLKKNEKAWPGGPVPTGRVLGAGPWGRER